MLTPGDRADEDFVLSLDTGLLNLALTSAIRCILVCSWRVSLSANILLHMVQLNMTDAGAGTGVMVVVAVDSAVAAGGAGGSSTAVLMVVVPAAGPGPAGGGVTFVPSRK